MTLSARAHALSFGDPKHQQAAIDFLRNHLDIHLDVGSGLGDTIRSNLHAAQTSQGHYSAESGSAARYPNTLELKVDELYAAALLSNVSATSHHSHVSMSRESDAYMCVCA